MDASKVCAVERFRGTVLALLFHEPSCGEPRLNPADYLG
jgi:hypothetical protein